MPLSTYRTLLLRFAATRKTDGWRVAIGKTCAFVARRALGRVPGTLGAFRVAGAGRGQPYLGGVWATLAQQDAFHIPKAPMLQKNRRRIALIGDLNLPQCRKYRVEQAAHFWHAQGVDLDYAHYLDVPRAVRLMQDATHLMCYRLAPGRDVSMYLYEARRLGLPVIYDIDDPLFSIPAYETYGNMAALDPALKAQFIAQAPGYLDMMNAADLITVSTPTLARHAAQLSPRPVMTRRNYADEATLFAGNRALHSTIRGQGASFRAAFASGSRGHEADFATIAAPVSEFLAQDPQRRLMILGHFDKTLLPDALLPQTQWHDFTSYEGYLYLLATADCAVMPLSDDLFNRCKSAVRAIDAACVALPVIAPPTGDFPAFIKDGETGLVAADDAAWLAGLNRLAADREFTCKMGDNARNRVETDWTVTGRAPAHIADRALLDRVLA